MNRRTSKLPALQWAMVAALASTAPLAHGETIIFKDGSFVEGKIVIETSRTIRVDTQFGERSFQRKDIERIVSTGQTSAAEGAVAFDKLPEAWQAVLDAEAEYKLGKYKQALARIQEYKSTSASEPALKKRIDWMLVRLYERLSRWEQAIELLEQRRSSGDPRERVRATAHLDIFEWNPSFDLRFIGRKHARNFLDDDLRELAREPGALSDVRIMRAALEEYCDQKLIEDEFSVRKFADALDVEDTHRAILSEAAGGDITRKLPYLGAMKKAETTIYEVQSILGDYGQTFEIDLVRTEMIHLLAVYDRVLSAAMAVSPSGYEPSFDRRTMLLSAQGRKEWQSRCDQFLDKTTPLVLMLEYMIDKVDRFPGAMRDLRERLAGLQNRLDEMNRSVKKARTRTRR